MKTIGSFIKLKRNTKGLSQRQVCKAAGINETWIHQVENNKSRTSLEFVECVFAVLETTLTEYDNYKRNVK